MYYDGILTARQWRECCLRTVLVKWSPEARGHVPPPSSIAAGAARAAGAAGQVGTHPRVLREEKFQLLPCTAKTVYLKGVKTQEWETGLMG